MEKMYVIELAIAAVIFFIMFILMFIKKLGKARIWIAIISILVVVGLCSHVTYKYNTEEPLLELKGEKTITLQANSSYAEAGVIGEYHNKDIADKVTETGNVDTAKPGEYTVKYSYNYGNNKVKEIERTVIVEDKEAPLIELKGKKEMTLYTDEKYTEPGYTAKDNVDGDLRKQVKAKRRNINSSKYEMIYTVKDSSGNEASVTRTVNLKKREIKPANNNASGNTSTGTTTTGNSSTTPQTGSQVTGPNSGVIYLTFDDGPTLDTTPKILDILKEENVKATFFILNYGPEKEYLIKREANEGHTIGIHGYSHDYKKIYQSVDTYMENITKLQDKIKVSTGINTNITRFPGGSSNTVSRNYCKGIMTKLVKEVVDRGYKYFDWNVSSTDAGGAKNKDQVYKNVTTTLKRNRSNVVLMHDFAGNTKTVDALRAIIQYGKQNGYTFKPITQDTPMITHGVNN